jgi:hypothetical protein
MQLGIETAGRLLGILEPARIVDCFHSRLPQFSLSLTLPPHEMLSHLFVCVFEPLRGS